MSPSTHVYHHFINGLRYVYGLGLNTLSVDGTGITADAQFGVDVGAVSDEDLYLAISPVVATTGLPVYYMTGAGADWNRSIVSGFSARTFGGTSATRLAYNQYTGGAWQLTQVPSNDFVLYHVFATTEKDTPMISVMGQEVYATKRLAREGALTEIQSIVVVDAIFPEMRPIATVIMQTNLSYASAINAKIVSTDDGDNYVDWRSETVTRSVVSTSDHGSLTGLLVDDHTQYLLADGTRALSANWAAGAFGITGLKTVSFASEPAIGSSGAAFNWTLANGQQQNVTLDDDTSDMTIVTAGVGPNLYRLRVIHSGASRTIAGAVVSGGVVRTPGGTALTLSSGDGDIDWIYCLFDGTNCDLGVIDLDMLTWT